METGWTTAPCPATNLSISICKSSARTKQSVTISLKTRNKIGKMYYMKRHFCIDPMTLLVSHQAVPPTFYNKIAPMMHRVLNLPCLNNLWFGKQEKRFADLFPKFSKCASCWWYLWFTLLCQDYFHYKQLFRLQLCKIAASVWQHLAAYIQLVDLLSEMVIYVRLFEVLQCNKMHFVSTPMTSKIANVHWH